MIWFWRFIVAILAIASLARADSVCYENSQILISECRPDTVLIPLSLNVAFDELTEGNAALHYRKAINLIDENLDFKLIKERLKSNFDSYDDYHQIVYSYSYIYQEIRRGTFCDHCDWGELAYKSTVSKEISDFKGIQKLVDLLLVKVRYELIKEDRADFDEVIGIIRDGFKLSANLNKSMNYENRIAAFLISKVFLRELYNIIQRPGAPILFDALSSFYYDNGLYQAYRVHNGKPWLEFPRLKLLCNFDISDEERIDIWNEYCESVHREWEKIDLKGTRVKHEIKPEILAVVKKDREQALQFFKQKGIKQKKIEAIPAPILAEMFHMCSYQEQLNRMYHLMKMEAWLVLDEISSARKVLFEKTSFATLTYFDDINIEIDTMNPYAPELSMFASYYYLTLELEQQIRILVILEALRDYFYSNQKLAESLCDIANRLPIDPVTGKCFEYSKVGNQGVIEYTIINYEYDREARQATIVFKENGD